MERAAIGLSCFALGVSLGIWFAVVNGAQWEELHDNLYHRARKEHYEMSQRLSNALSEKSQCQAALQDVIPRLFEPKVPQ